MVGAGEMLTGSGGARQRRWRGDEVAASVAGRRGEWRGGGQGRKWRWRWRGDEAAASVEDDE
jgi:hypothetical protein